MNRLKDKYQKKVSKLLSEEFDIKNEHAIPSITKIVVNMGIGDAAKNKELLASAKEDLSKITGQLPSVRPAKLSIASFGIRAGVPVGLKVTLRGDRMYDFLDRLISVVLPRLRDFRGVSLKSFDKNGNYSLGIYDHSVFPEVEMSKTGSRGLEITIVTNTNSTKKSKKLLTLLGMPFEKKE